MDAHEAERVETALSFALPEDYRRFLLAQPGEAYETRWRDSKGFHHRELFNSADALIVNNLELRSTPGVTPRGEVWPEGRLAIGRDGSGNLYALDRQEGPSPRVLLESHDPAGVEVVAPSFPRWMAGTVRDAEGDDGYDDPTGPPGGLAALGSGEPVLFVTRATAWWKSVTAPIALDAWRRHVRGDPALGYRGFETSRNPFTGEALRIERPGLAVWSPSARVKVGIRYRFGGLYAIGNDAPLVSKMAEIARAFDARLFDSAEGERPTT